MASDDRVLLSLTASRGEAARLRQKFPEIALAGPTRRRKAELRPILAGLSGRAEIALLNAGRPRAAALRLRRDGPAMLTEEATTPLGTAAGDGAAIRAALDALAVDTGETEVDADLFGPPIALVQSHITLHFADVPILWSTTRTVDGGDDIEVSVAASDAETLLRFASLVHAELPLPLAWPRPADDAPAHTGDRIVLAGNGPAADAFRVAALSCLRQVAANREGVLAGRPEAVHQMRVGLRRLRALLGLFRPILEPTGREDLRTPLSALQKRLGPVRDWDVFGAELLAPLQTRLPDSDALRVAAVAAAAEREAAMVSAGEAVASPEFTRIILAAGAWILSAGCARAEADEDARRFAERLLSRQHRKLRKRGRKHAEDDATALHEIRIQAKKLRYAVEFFASLHGGRKQKRFLKRVKLIQEVLGVVNDAAVAEGLVDALAARMRAQRVEPTLAGEATGLIRGWQLAHAEDERRRFGSVWDDYADTPRYWD